MHQSIAFLLLPEYRRRVLALLLLEPAESLHGREVARRTGLAAGAIARELAKLAEAGLLKREKRGNQQVYRADTDSPIFTELAGMLRKTSGLADVLAEALAPLARSLPPHVTTAKRAGRPATISAGPRSDKLSIARPRPAKRDHLIHCLILA